MYRAPHKDTLSPDVSTPPRPLVSVIIAYYQQEGFIADELQQVIPSAVNGEKNALTSKGTIQPQTINIVPVVAVLTKAVQEQQQIIEQQKSDIETQKNDIDTLKTQVAELTKTVNTLMNK